MQSSRIIVAGAVLAGVALLVVAGIYFGDTARALPSFFPGAAVVVALALFVFAWFASGPRKAAASA